MENELILHKLNRIEKFMFGLKDILNVEELVEYTGYSKSYIYKLVHTSRIPYAKPEGGGNKLFFERKKIDNWLLHNSHKCESDSTKDAFNYLAGKK